MPLEILKSFDFAHRGCDVKHYAKGEVLNDPDPELVKVALDEKWGREKKVDGKNAGNSTENKNAGNAPENKSGAGAGAGLDAAAAAVGGTAGAGGTDAAKAPDA